MSTPFKSPTLPDRASDTRFESLLQLAEVALRIERGQANLQLLARVAVEKSNAGQKHGREHDVVDRARKRARMDEETEVEVLREMLADVTIGADQEDEGPEHPASYPASVSRPAGTMRGNEKTVKPKKGNLMDNGMVITTNGEPRWVCRICQRDVAARTSDVWRHLRTHDPQAMRQFHCQEPECKCYTEHATDLPKDMEVHDQNLVCDLPTDDGPCGFTGSDPGQFSSHQGSEKNQHRPKKARQGLKRTHQGQRRVAPPPDRATAGPSSSVVPTSAGSREVDIQRIPNAKQGLIFIHYTVA